MTKLQEGILTPHEHDVLSGRGNFVNYHAGNEHFRALVRKHKVAYVACPKPQKGKFSKLIYDEIRTRNPPGRFLKQDLKTKLWYDIGEKKALDKTRQALREGAPEIQKELCGDDEDDDDGDDEGGAEGAEFDDSPGTQSPLQQQRVLSFASEVDVEDRTPVMGMRNSVNQINRVQLPFDFPASHTDVDNIGMGMQQPPLHHLSQQAMLQSGNVGLHANVVAVASLPTVHNVMEPVSSSHQGSSALQHPVLQLPDNPQLRQLQQHRQLQHQQQQLQHHFQLQQLQQQQQQQQRQIQGSQQQQNLLPQPRTHSMQVNQLGMGNAHGGNTRGNLTGNRSYSDSTSLHSKFATSGIPTHLNNLNNLNNFHVGPNPFEPRPIDPYHVSYFRKNEGVEPPSSPSFQETEDVGPLPSRRHVLPRERKNQLMEHDNSCSSLVVDNIFSAGDTKPIEQTSGASAANTTVSNKSSRFNLSGLSLSISSDMNEEAEQLGSLLNSSLRLTNKAPPKQPFKRSSSFDADDASLSEVSGSRHHMSYFGAGDMSVATFNTLGDGEASMTRMLTDSQAEMSIGNVFDDVEPLPTKSTDNV